MDDELRQRMAGMSDEELKALGAELGLDLTLPEEPPAPEPDADPQPVDQPVDESIPAELMAAETDEMPPEPPNPDWGTAWAGLQGEEREQAIRDHYGYTRAETRTEQERRMAAERMVANSSRADWIGPLPDDIKAIWGNTAQDEKMARGLIGAWGLDKFRESALHKQALSDKKGHAVKEHLRAAFIKAKQKEMRKA